MSPTDDRERTTRQSLGLAGGAVAMLGREAVRLPLFALTVSLHGLERARAVRDFAFRRGGEALQLAALTPLGRFLPKPLIDDGADAEAARITEDARVATGQAEAGLATLTPVRDAADQVAEPPAATPPAKPQQATPKPVTAPKRPAPEAVAAGAPGVVTEQVDKVTEQVDVEEPSSREDLPIPDFDNVTIGSLRARLRSLSVEQLVVLREWEQAHANRLPVVTLLDNRIAKLAAETTTPYPAETGTTVRV